MNASEASTETTSVAQRADAASIPPAAELEPPAINQEDSPRAPPGSEETSAVPADGPDRRKLEEQLAALKRKELELKRALLMADHPALADAIRRLEGRAYALNRAEAKLAQGLSKAEARRRETLDKKLEALRAKRSELDVQIAALEAEYQTLGTERTQAFEAERHRALEELIVELASHEPALRAAGIDASSLVPDLARWLPDIEALAASAGPQANRRPDDVDPRP